LLLLMSSSAMAAHDAFRGGGRGSAMHVQSDVT
jgi:hypothetical protein